LYYGSGLSHSAALAFIVQLSERSPSAQLAALAHPRRIASSPKPSAPAPNFQSAAMFPKRRHITIAEKIK
jgi:hypothetical protein